MKLLLLFLYLFPVFSGKDVPVTKYVPVTKDGPTINVIMIIGKKSNGCKGFGICQFKIDIDWNSEALASGSGFGNATVANGKLKLELDNRSMTEETLTQYFSGTTFKVEEQFELSPEVCRALEIPAYMIREGAYKVTKTTEKTTISF